MSGLSKLPSTHQMKGVITNFIDPHTYGLIDKIFEIFDDYPHYNTNMKLYFTVGIHPDHAWAYYRHKNLQFITRTINNFRYNAKCIAIGECGLGPNYNCPMKEQVCAFEEQLKLARYRSMSVVIHVHELCHMEALEICKTILHRSHHIHLHCFVGDYRKYELWVAYFPNLAIGLTHKVMNDTRLQEVATRLSLDRLLIETDSPHMPPAGCPISKPEMAIGVAEYIAR